IYAIKRLSNGNLLAVGRKQEGEGNLPCRGYMIFIDERGETADISEDTAAPSANTRRSAFQDVAEMADGSLVFAGWATQSNNTDDIWVFKRSADGKKTKAVT